MPIQVAALAAGRKFLCVGPHCWGKGLTAEEAIANAKKNRAKVYEGAAGWRYILYDAQDDAVIDDMGSICYVPREGVEPYREVLRYESKPKKGRG